MCRRKGIGTKGRKPELKDKEFERPIIKAAATLLYYPF